MNNFANGDFDKALAQIYAQETIEAQKARYDAAITSFTELFGEREIQVYSAPGRTEICGNHTDHQHGQVIAGSVNIDTIAIVSPTDDNIVEIKSEGYELFKTDLNDLAINEAEFGTTTALVRGVAASLKERGYTIGGFKAYMTSDVLSGSGLSSSAAFEVLIGTILSGMYNGGRISSEEQAIVGQIAENKFFGKPCGLMDQMACAVGGIIHIDFADPTKPVVEKVNVNFVDYGHSLCIVDTKGSHADLTDDYAAVPQEMCSVAKFFGKDVLREVPEEKFYESFNELREKLGDRAVLRAAHLYDENRRVEEMTDALNKGDFDTFKKIVDESGNSSFMYLQNVYANHKPQAQSVSVSLMMAKKALAGRGVCRVHGGGFAGTMQAFVPNELVAEYKEKMEKVFGEGACHVLTIRNFGGFRLI